MKHKFSFTTLAFLFLMIPFLFGTGKAVEAATTVDVTTYGADGSDTADDTTAIQSALNLAQNEDAITVIIPAGTYYVSDALKIYSNTTLSLDDNAVMVQTADSIIIRNKANTEAENIVIDGGTWKTNASGSANFMYFTDTQNLTIQNTTIQDANSNAIYAGNSQIAIASNSIDTTGNNGIRLADGCTGSVFSNTVKNVDKVGISIDDARDMDVYENTVTNLTNGSGMAFKNATGSSSIKKNTVVGGHNSCIEIKKVGTKSSPVIVSENNFSASDTHAIYAEDSYVTFENNVIDNAGTVGIRVVYDSFATISNNTITNCDKSGVSINQATATISNNTISSFGTYGIYVEGGDIVITDNVISDSTKYDIFVTDDNDVGWKSTGTISGNTASVVKINSSSVVNEDEKIKISSCKFTLSKEKYVANGKARKPSVTVKDGSNTLVKGTDYSLSYSNNVKVGEATVKVTGKGNYTGSKSLSYQIIPDKTSITSAKRSSSTKIKLKWKKQTGITGYQIQYSTKKDMSGSKKLKVAKSKKSATLSKLKKGKKYYVRIRTYKTVSGTNYYSKWSAKKKVK